MAVWVEATGAPCAVCKRYYASTSRACDQDGHTSDSTYTCTWINGVFWPLWPVIHRPGCLGQDRCVGESTGGWTVAGLVPPLPFVSYYRVTNFNVPLLVCFYTSTVGRQSVLSVFSQFYSQSLRLNESVISGRDWVQFGNSFVWIFHKSPAMGLENGQQNTPNWKHCCISRLWWENIHPSPATFSWIEHAKI